MLKKTLIAPLLIPLLLAFALPAVAQETPGGQAAPVDLTSPDRQPGDADRDAHSKPIEVFRWIGVEPGNVVLDFHAGSGYNTWILSEWVGPGGVVFAEAPEQYSEELKTRLESGDLQDAGNVVFVGSLQEVPDDSLDLFFVSRNYHDVPAEEIPAFLAEVERTLKPGGTLAVIDARAAEGRDEEAHRIADQVIIDEVTAAGFEHVESSELLANPDDDHVGPKWEMRAQLDQSLIKFRAPEAGADAPAAGEEPAAEPAPETPDTPENPETPDTPENPETPDTPEELAPEAEPGLEPEAEPAPEPVPGAEDPAPETEEPERPY